MGLIEELLSEGDRQSDREARIVLASLLLRAADALEKLMHYAEHEMGCLGLPHACMCGLGELLKELSDD